MSSITMSHLKIASVRLCAFGGAADSQKELPLMVFEVLFPLLCLCNSCFLE
jgi:hypothetical protein